MAPYLQRFADFSVVRQLTSFFSLHVNYRFKIVLCECVLAVLMMLRDTGVVPLFFLDSAGVFVPPESKVSIGLANIYGGFRAGAGVFVDAFFL